MPRLAKACLVDTNVLLRFFLADDLQQTPKAIALFKRASEGREILEIGDGVLAETVWVLEKLARISRIEIARHLVRLLTTPGVQTQGGKGAILDAFASYGRTPCDFVDCLLDARARSRRAKVYTFDVTDFKRLRCNWAEPV